MSDFTVAIGKVRMILVTFVLLIFAIWDVHRFSYVLAPIFVNLAYFILVLISEAWKQIKKFQK